MFVALPTVEDEAALTDDLAAAGVIAARLDPSATVDVRKLRERLRLTREQFAASYGLEVETMRNWETGKREPDTTARSYLCAIANDPAGVQAAYGASPLSGSLIAAHARQHRLARTVSGPPSLMHRGLACARGPRWTATKPSPSSRIMRPN